jgi:CRP-like cAMP-binding protein
MQILKALELFGSTMRRKCGEPLPQAPSDTRQIGPNTGAVFGELSVLLDQPHTADVRALETSQFHVVNATALLAQNPIAALYVATVLARRLDGANDALIQLKNQLQTGEAHSVIAKTVSRMEGLLVVGDEFLDD